MSGSAAPSGAPDQLPWIWLCSRLVTAKNSASPEITSQPIDMPRSCTNPTRTCSISATPPPVAVELTFQIVRPANPGPNLVSEAGQLPRTA